MLVDIKEHNIKALSPDKKLFMEIPYKPNAAEIARKDIQTKKTGATKNILGYPCNEYKVTSKEQNTEISYWLADGNFDFFHELLSTLNRKDNFPAYFMQLYNVDGTFPLLAIERTLQGEEKSRLEVTKLERKILDYSLFAVPKDYQKYATGR